MAEDLNRKLFQDLKKQIREIVLIIINHQENISQNFN